MPKPTVILRYKTGTGQKIIALANADAMAISEMEIDDAKTLMKDLQTAVQDYERWEASLSPPVPGAPRIRAADDMA